MIRRTPEQAFQDFTQNVPASLSGLDQWVRLWVTKQHRDKQTKELLSDLGPVDSDHKPLGALPWQLTSFDDIVAYFQWAGNPLNEGRPRDVLSPTVGAGFVIGPDDPFTIIEALNAYPDAADKLQPFAAELVRQFPMAYIERSRCGRNLQFVVRSSLTVQSLEYRVPGCVGAVVEVNDRSCYLPITGDVEGVPVDPVADGAEPLAALIKRIESANAEEASRPDATKPASASAIKEAASGRWSEVLTAAGMSPAMLVEGQHPCPKCFGKDRFNVPADFNETGAVFCRKCFFDKTSKPSPGDGIATLRWFRGWKFREVCLWLTKYFGLLEEQPNAPEDIIAATCCNKRMPVDAFLAFGAKPANRGRDKRPVARVPVYNETGVVHSYFDLAPDLKGLFKPGKGSDGLFFPSRVPATGETWLMVEGVKDAAALLGLGYNPVGLPRNVLPKRFADLFVGANIIIVPDLDNAGQRGAVKTGGNIVGIAASVRVARLPGEVVASGGEDVRDVLRRPDGEQAVRDAIANAKPWEPDPNTPAKDGRPEVLVTLDEPKVFDQIVGHVGKLGWNDTEEERLRVFVRGGMLTGVLPSEDIDADGRLSIRPLPAVIVRERIVAACQLVQGQGDDAVAVPTRPQKWLIDGVAQRGFYNGAFHPLTGIIYAPTIRQDGSLLQADGYDSQTGLILQTTDTFPEIADKPTHADAAHALKLLSDVVDDFPFYADADRSAWLALVLSLIGRQCVAGCVPLFAITANIRGAGKSKLVDAASIIAYGRPAARKTFTRNDDELRKVITSVTIEAIPSILFDNVDIQLGGASLDAALTGTTWSDRVLGASRTTGELPMRTVWSATGNNMAFGSDIARRILPVRLQSPDEAPENRTGFMHDDLEGWTKAHRPELAVAALTILRAYFVAGCPYQAGGSWGSFESWSRLIRGALVWAGAADPLPTREAAADNDDSLRLVSLLIVGIQQADMTGGGLTTNDIEIASHHYDALKEAINEVCGDRWNPKQFGKRMRSCLGRVLQGRRIEAATAGGGVKRYRVVASGSENPQTHVTNSNPPANPPQNANENRAKPTEGGLSGFNLESLRPGGVVCVPNSDARDTHKSAWAPGETDPLNPPNPLSPPECLHSAGLVSAPGDGPHKSTLPPKHPAPREEF